jgi:hypothetical protein
VKTRLSIKIFLLSLATLVLFNGFGFYAFAYLETGIHRSCLRENEGEKQMLVLDGKAFSSVSWIGRTDFIYNDKVYDCESIVVSHGKIIISCTSDKEETAIKNTLAGSFETNSKNSSPAAKNLLKFFPVFPLAENLSITAASPTGAAIQNDFYQVPLSILHGEVSSPPPELA